LTLKKNRIEIIRKKELKVKALIAIGLFSLAVCNQNQSGTNYTDENLSLDSVKANSKKAYIYAITMIGMYRTQYAYFVDSGQAMDATSNKLAYILRPISYPL
jgi:hypothetical protein